MERERELLRIFLKVSQMENTILRRMNLSSFLMVSSRFKIKLYSSFELYVFFGLWTPTASSLYCSGLYCRLSYPI